MTRRRAVLGARATPRDLARSRNRGEGATWVDDGSRAALASAGWQEALDGTPFRAHVTLGRPRGRSGIDRLEGLLEEMTFVGERHSLEEVTLVESRRSSAGATYTAVARFPWEGA